MVNKIDLLLLYDRPLEPAFVGKGQNNTVFAVPQSYLPDRYKPIADQITQAYADEAQASIPVKEIKLPNLGEILNLKRDSHFSLFLPKHMYLAGLLIDLFMAMRNIEELQSMAIYARDRVNPFLFNYAYSVALIHRPDTQDLPIPSLFYSFPEKFIDGQYLQQAREECYIVPEGSRIPIVIPVQFTASDLDVEHRLWYFREDLGINLHHWHWHLVYPFSGTLEIVNKNRRGELFYYMHQQVIARYDAERLCNALARVDRSIDWNQPIREAYFSKLTSYVASHTWPPRPHNVRVRNVNRDEDEIHQTIEDLVQWRNRIVAGIDSGFLIDPAGNRVPLTENEGIDILTNTVESNILSVNSSFYGNYHNMGHICIAYCHDPDGRFLESVAIMGDTGVSMRDPVFYRWHGYLDFILQKHKNSLPRYPIEQLNYDGITVTDIKVESSGAPDNEFNTFWQQSDLDLSTGLDFERRGPIFIRITHLQHHKFSYNITVDNAGAERKGTCRIFLAPKYDEAGTRWLFRDQKNMFMALDRFTVDLSPGINTITRKSTQSTVTIPWEQTFRSLDPRGPPLPTEGDALAQLNFCGCGWPQHMLIPKGTHEGYPCQLFVMISNYADDRIIQDISGLCNDADNYCGVKDKLYPDRRSMGYPFDRMPRNGVSTLRQFLTSNMRVQDVKIRFNNRTLRPREAF